MNHEVILSLVVCIIFSSCDITEINIAGLVNLNNITGCNKEHAKLIIEQNDITEEYEGYLTDENLTFRIYFKNNINYDEPVNMKIYPMNNSNELFCSKYLQAKNIKLKTINREMKIYGTDISNFAILINN